MCSAFLSRPAARPTRFGNASPITVTGDGRHRRQQPLRDAAARGAVEARERDVVRGLGVEREEDGRNERVEHCGIGRRAHRAWSARRGGDCAMQRRDDTIRAPSLHRARGLRSRRSPCLLVARLAVRDLRAPLLRAARCEPRRTPRRAGDRYAQRARRARVHRRDGARSTASTAPRCARVFARARPSRRSSRRWTGRCSSRRSGTSTRRRSSRRRASTAASRSGTRTRATLAARRGEPTACRRRSSSRSSASRRSTAATRAATA